jgi:hypothetical protein
MSDAPTSFESLLARYKSVKFLVLLLLLGYTAFIGLTFGAQFSSFNLHYAPFEPDLGFLRNDTLVASCFNSTTRACKHAAFSDHRYDNYVPYVIYSPIWGLVVMAPLLWYFMFKNSALLLWLVAAVQFVYSVGMAVVSVTHVVWYVRCEDNDICTGPVPDYDVTGLVNRGKFPDHADPSYIAHISIVWALALLSWALLALLVKFAFQWSYFSMKDKLQNPLRNVMRGLQLTNDGIDRAANNGAMGSMAMIEHIMSAIDIPTSVTGGGAVMSTQRVAMATEPLMGGNAFAGQLREMVFGDDRAKAQ